jgi:acetate kinase
MGCIQLVPVCAVTLKIMTLNAGSSSLKYSLWDMPSGIELCEGVAERVTMQGGFIKHRPAGMKEVTLTTELPSHDKALASIMELLTGDAARETIRISDVKGVGHRVVHGGAKFTRSVVVDEEVLKAIREFSELAPLHNPSNLAGIKAAMKILPDIPHVAVFDTAFLTTLPPQAYMYGLPYEWYEKHRVRKYGFHGTSHRYVSRRAAVLLGKRPTDVNVISLHVGNGVSVTAVRKGLAYDHSMGFTPLEGAVMGTRCGDIDTAIVFHVMRRENLTPAQVEEILNKRSGLLGITGKYVDRRDIVEAANRGDERAKLAIDVECYRLKKIIGAYAAAMNGVDALVFTAGVGENSPLHRRRICDNLEFLGIRLNPSKNEAAVHGNEMEISSENSSCKIFVIPTDEERMIAEDVSNLLHAQ